MRAVRQPTLRPKKPKERPPKDQETGLDGGNNAVSHTLHNLLSGKTTDCNALLQAEDPPATLQNKQDIDKYCKSNGIPERVRGAATAALHSLSCGKEIYDDIWSGVQVYKPQSSLNLVLLLADKALENSDERNAVQRRINSVLYVWLYEKRVASDQIEKGQPKTRATIVLDCLVKESEENGKPRTREQIQALIKSGRWVGRLLARYGFGAVLAMGVNAA